MACRFIEADDKLIELLKWESENKTQNEAQAIGKEFLKSGRKLGKGRTARKLRHPRIERSTLAILRCAEKRKRSRLRARLAKGDAGRFRSTFKKPKLSKVYPEGYRVPVFEESVGREGEKAARTRDGKTTQQSKKPDEGRRGDTMAKRPVRQPNPSLSDKNLRVSEPRELRCEPCKPCEPCESHESCEPQYKC